MTSIYALASQDDVLARYIKDIYAIPLLTKEEEIAAAKKWFNEKCIKSAHLLVTSHLRLVVKIAIRFRFCGLPIMDLISEGNIGLMHAVKKFDPNKGFRLSTYAIWWIKAAIYEHMIKCWSLVKIGTSTTQKKLFYNLTKLKQQILNEQDTSRQLNNAEIQQISEKIGISANAARTTINRLANPDKSLNLYTDDENKHEMLDTLQDERQNHEMLYIETEDLNYKKNLLQAAIKNLDEREKAILQGRYLDQPTTTLQQLATKYSISCERVRQIEKSVLNKIRGLLDSSLSAIPLQYNKQSNKKNPLPTNT